MKKLSDISMIPVWCMDYGCLDSIDAEAYTKYEPGRAGIIGITARRGRPKRKIWKNMALRKALLTWRCVRVLRSIKTEIMFLYLNFQI